MELFTASSQQQQEFQAHEAALDALRETLQPWALNESDLAALEKLKTDFHDKIADFFRENRHLNIGVVGQVKAGKSSFLNTLLFEGRSVLPKAATPKTAVLTRITYDSTSSITVHYLSRDAWAQIQDAAAMDDEEDEMCMAARELVAFQHTSGLNPAEKLDRTERVTFDSLDDLQRSLNDFVGENGRYTPLVESVLLGLPLEELRDLTIVDTPGLNDPVVSRTLQTREFLKVCDVVFFLSQSGSFLDSNDWELLSGQMPQKGVNRLVLVASKADSALLDVLRTCGGPDPLDDEFGFDEGPMGIREAMDQVRTKLTGRARAQVSAFIRRSGDDNPVARAVSTCANPIPISSMLENMRRKDPADYDREEANIYRRLEPHFRDPAGDMERIGNFAVLRDMFQKTIREKEDILLQKGRDMLPTAQGELRGTLSELKKRTLQRMNTLEHGDIRDLEARRTAIERQENGLKGDVSAAVGEALTRLAEEQSRVISEMRSLTAESGKLSERTGSREVTTTYTTYRHRFLFFKWGRETHTSTHTERYRYLAAADAVEQIRDYAATVASSCEEIFGKAVDLHTLRRKLLNAVVVNLDASDDAYDAGLCKQVAEQVLRDFTFPVLHLSFEDICQSITSRFTGEITSSHEKDQLREQLAKAVDQVLRDAVTTLQQEIQHFRTQLQKAGDTFSERLLAQIQQEYQNIIAASREKQDYLQRGQRYVAELDGALSRLP